MSTIDTQRPADGLMDALSVEFQRKLALKFKSLQECILQEQEVFIAQREQALKDEITGLRREVSDSALRGSSGWTDEAAANASTSTSQVSCVLRNGSRNMPIKPAPITTTDPLPYEQPPSSSPRLGALVRLPSHLPGDFKSASLAVPTDQGLGSCSVAPFGKVGKLGQVIRTTAEDLIRDLPLDVFHKISHFVKEPDPAHGLPHFFSNMSYAMLGHIVMHVTVVSNVVILGFQADSDWDGWIYVNACYGIIFFIEIVFAISGKGWERYLCRGKSRNWLWHLFDISLVSLSFLEVVLALVASIGDHANNVMLLRTVRLIRIARLMRLLHLDVFRDLMMMVDGALGGMRTLGWSMVLITVPIYAFSLVLTETVGQKVDSYKPWSEGDDFDIAEHFSTLPRSMFTGFRCLVLGDCSANNGTPIFPWLVARHGWFYGVFYIVAFLCINFGLFNVIVAIYVDNVQAAAKGNDLLQKKRRLEDRARFAEQMLLMTRFLWAEFHKGSLEMSFQIVEALQMEMTKEFWELVTQDPRLHMYLENLDVPQEDHVDLFEICDSDASGVLTIDELVMGIKRLRGDPRRSDLVFVMLRVRELIGEVHFLRTDVTAIRSKLRHSQHAQSPAAMTSARSCPPAEAAVVDSAMDRNLTKDPAVEADVVDLAIDREATSASATACAI